MIVDKIITSDRKELNEVQLKYVSNMSEIGYIESCHSYFLYLEDLENNILDSISEEEDNIKEVKELYEKLKKYAIDNEISTIDLKILITL